MRLNIERITRPIRRFWSAITQPGTGGLIQPGDWRCRYPDGFVSRWMSRGDAANMRDCFGGVLEWRGDIPASGSGEAANG